MEEKLVILIEWKTIEGYQRHDMFCTLEMRQKHFGTILPPNIHVFEGRGGFANFFENLPLKDVRIRELTFDEYERAIWGDVYDRFK